MRRLTVKQKKLLDLWIKDNPGLVNWDFSFDMPEFQTTWDKLWKINPTEILWNEVERYVYDNATNILLRK